METQKPTAAKQSGKEGSWRTQEGLWRASTNTAYGSIKQAKVQKLPLQGVHRFHKTPRMLSGRKKIIFFTNASGSKEYTHLKRKGK